VGVHVLTAHYHADSAPPQTPSTTLYKSRVRTEPTSATAPQWAAALWLGLERMIEDMADCCIKANRWKFPMSFSDNPKLDKLGLHFGKGSQDEERYSFSDPISRRSYDCTLEG
jgi:hypothetical protein